MSQTRRSLAASSALLLLGVVAALLSSGAPVLAARLLQPTEQAELQGSLTLVADAKTGPLAQEAASAVVLSNRRSKSKEVLGKAWRSKGKSVPFRLSKSENVTGGPYSTLDGLRAAERSLQQSDPPAAAEADLGVIRYDLTKKLVDDGESMGLGSCIHLQLWGGLTEGQCCVFQTWELTSLADFKGCTAVLQYTFENVPVKPQTLQIWLDSLPPNVKALDLSLMDLTGTLPESFGANSALEVLWLENNLFTGSLPGKWAELTGLRSLDLSNYPVDDNKTIWGNNSFSGSLPEGWGSSLKSLESIGCTGGACDGLEGTIPASWSALCNLSELAFDSSREGWGNNKMHGKLPWSWIYDKPTDWNDTDKPRADLSCIPDKISVGGAIELPQMFCLARGNPAVTSDKFFVHNNGAWGAVVAAGDMVPAKLEAVSFSDKLNMTLDPARNLCVSHHRFTFIGAVYGVFGFLVLCAVLDLLWPKKASCCACLDPEGAKEAGQDVPLQQHPAIAKAVPIVFAGSKLLLVVIDLASDILATWAIRRTDFVWVFAAMLLVPNVLAALVLHLRLCHINHHSDKWKMLFVPTTYRMYESLYRKGGLALLHASIVFLWPYWVFLQVPILFAASFGRMIGRCRQSNWSMQWLNLPHFCSLLSLIMACTESPFSAVVFTYFYAHGMTAQFPTLIKDWNFVLTVFTALLHMVMEFWRMVPYIKAGRFKQRMRSLFLDVVVAKQVAGGTSALEKSVDLACDMGSNNQHGNKSVEYYYPGEVPEVQSMGKAPVIVAVDEGGQVERPGLGGQGVGAGREAAVTVPAGGAGVAGDTQQKHGDGPANQAGALSTGGQQLGKGVVYYYPAEVPGFGGMSTSPDAAVGEERHVEGGVGWGENSSLGNAGRGAGRGAGRSAPRRGGGRGARGAWRGARSGAGGGKQQEGRGLDDRAGALAANDQKVEYYYPA